MSDRIKAAKMKMKMRNKIKSGSTEKVMRGDGRTTWRRGGVKGCMDEMADRG